MSNLIITIISIAIIAVAAAMAIYYGGVAYENAQPSVFADIIMNEANQILQAERMWSSIHSCSDISCMGAGGTSGTGMSALVNDKELSEWPTMGGHMFSLNYPFSSGPTPLMRRQDKSYRE